MEKGTVGILTVEIRADLTDLNEKLASAKAKVQDLSRQAAGDFDTVQYTDKDGKTHRKSIAADADARKYLRRKIRAWKLGIKLQDMSRKCIHWKAGREYT